MKYIFTILLITCNYYIFSQVNLSSSLTACYSLDNNANEPINNLTGTLSAVTATVDRFNNANSAYYFSGSTSSYIKLPNSSLLKPNEISFSAWVKANSLTTTIMDVVFTKNVYTSYFTAYVIGAMNVGGGTYKFRIYRQNGGSDDYITSTTTINVNTWYHVAFSIDNTSMKLYVNGVLEASAAAVITSFNYDGTRHVILGGTNETYNDPWHGSIDNVRFYNRVITASEVSQLYTADPSCNPVPVSSFSVFPPTVCAGGTVALTDLSGNNPTSWNWQIPGASPSSPAINNPTVAFPNPGTYIVSMTGSNSAGAGNTATQSIVVLPNPTVTILSNGIVCLGQGATLVTSGASTYTWNTNQSSSSIVVNPVSNTTYSVTGTATNGCKSSAQKSVTVVALPSLNISGTGTICQGLPTSLLVNGSAITYSWSNGATGNIITVMPASSTVYTVTGTDVNGCTNTATQLVFVNTLPPVMANANSPAICVGDAAVLSGSGANTYLWTGGILNNVPFYPSTTATYTVTGTGANGCKNTASVQVVVNPLPVLSHSSSHSQVICSGEPVTLTAGGANIYSWSNGAVTPVVVVTPSVTMNYTVTGTDINGCKASFVFTQIVDACLGLKNVSMNTTHGVYPNPSDGKFTVDVYIEELNDYEVFNLMGVMVLKGRMAGAEKFLIDLSAYPNGIYFLKLKNAEILQTIKIVKE